MATIKHSAPDYLFQREHLEELLKVLTGLLKPQDGFVRDLHKSGWKFELVNEQVAYFDYAPSANQIKNALTHDKKSYFIYVDRNIVIPDECRARTIWAEELIYQDGEGHVKLAIDVYKRICPVAKKPRVRKMRESDLKNFLDRQIIWFKLMKRHITYNQMLDKKGEEFVNLSWKRIKAEFEAEKCYVGERTLQRDTEAMMSTKNFEPKASAEFTRFWLQRNDRDYILYRAEENLNNLIKLATFHGGKEHPQLAARSSTGHTPYQDPNA